MGIGGALQPRILIVDDDMVMLDIYSRVLSGQAYVVTFASSATTASALIKANHYESARYRSNARRWPRDGADFFIFTKESRRQKLDSQRLTG